jgi:dolichol-phosphate mannosyltransferase
MSDVELTLVIPTYNERDNIASLLGEIEQALAGTAWDVLFVDDSTDGTDAVIAGIGARDARVRLLRRDVNRGGLAGAVVEGLAAPGGAFVCVLDADLQHPPGKISELLARAQQTRADIVIASRYIPGGSAGGLAGPLRLLYSQGLRLLSKALFPRRLHGITDPLGGFFLVRRSVVEGVALRPVGYKILLEILVRCRWRRAREVPYQFQPRHAGASKADLRQGLLFLRHLGRLLWECSPVCTVPRGAARVVGERLPRPAQSRRPGSGGPSGKVGG